MPGLIQPFLLLISTSQVVCHKDTRSCAVIVFVDHKQGNAPGGGEAEDWHWRNALVLAYGAPLVGAVA